MLARFVDWAFRDRTDGRIVIGQWPNLTLWAFIAAWLVAWFAAWLSGPEGTIARAARAASWLALAIWAADELIRGVNPWRRFLGLVVLVWVVVRVST